MREKRERRSKTEKKKMMEDGDILRKLEGKKMIGGDRREEMSGGKDRE